jgi:hypothetical protein
MKMIIQRFLVSLLTKRAITEDGAGTDLQE